MSLEKMIQNSLMISMFALITILILPLNSHCYSYDHLQFVQLWSPTYCDTTTCISPLTPDFYVHGLWPADQKGKTIPCQHRLSNWNKVHSAVIKPNVDDIELQLFRAWPSISDGFDTKSFWKHEWDRHGRCTSPPMTESDYFWTIIKQRPQKDLLKILANAQISPSANRAYSRNQIQNAIDVVIGQGNEIYISCKKDNSTHARLFEIYVCLLGNDANNMVSISCPANSLTRSCHPDRTGANIIIPP